MNAEYQREDLEDKNDFLPMMADLIAGSQSQEHD